MAKVESRTAYWEDARENKWYKSLYTQEEAERMADTLVNCYNCVDCEFCKDCENCEDCTFCENCADCKNVNFSYNSDSKEDDEFLDGEEK